MLGGRQHGRARKRLTGPARSWRPTPQSFRGSIPAYAHPCQRVRDPLPEGFRHFVASMPALVASGWSESPGGPCTYWKAPPCHAGYDEFSIRRTQEKSSLVRDLWRVTESPIGGRPTFDQYGLGARTRQKKLMTPCISVIVYQSVFFAPLKAICSTSAVRVHDP